MSAARSGALRQRVLSGIQPTADSFHLGNYLGALRQWVAMQDEFETFYFIADQHAITVPLRPGAAAPPGPRRHGAAARSRGGSGAFDDLRAERDARALPS